MKTRHKKEYVIINRPKVEAQLASKKRNASDVCRKAGIRSSYYSDALSKSGKMEKSRFTQFCKELGIIPSYYIIQVISGKRDNTCKPNELELAPTADNKSDALTTETSESTTAEPEISKAETLEAEATTASDEVGPISTDKDYANVVDKPLVIHLKSYNELSELIEVQKGIGDALRELIAELKKPSQTSDSRAKD